MLTDITRISESSITSKTIKGPWAIRTTILMTQKTLHKGGGDKGLSDSQPLWGTPLGTLAALPWLPGGAAPPQPWQWSVCPAATMCGGESSSQLCTAAAATSQGGWAVLAPHCGAGICSATWLSKPGKESWPSVRCHALCNCLHCWMIMNPRGMCYHLNISEVHAEHVIAVPGRRGAEC